MAIGARIAASAGECMGILRRSISDLAFPDFCLGCGAEGHLFCRECADRMLCSPVMVCPICKAADEKSHCAGGDLDHLWTLASYGDNLIAESIRMIKYDFASGLVHEFWNKHLAAFLRQAGDVLGPDSALIPVPLHRRRHLERGFNQSESAARELAGISGLPVNCDLLKRIVYNEPQVGLSGRRRADNIKGIFKCDYRALSGLWGKRLILLDDVYTTGSTMAECAKVLKSAGFKRVSGLALAVD